MGRIRGHRPLSEMDWAGAIAEYERIIQQRGPTTPPVRAALAFQGRGRCLRELGRHAEAVDALRTAVGELEAAAKNSPSAGRFVGAAREELARAQDASGDSAGAMETRKSIPPARPPQ